MNLREIQKILNAEVLVGEEVLDQIEPRCVCGSDLMSDVLTFTKEKTLLLTGLTNSQVIRTADMIDLSAVVFVRGKKPPPEVIEMARKNNLPLLSTVLPLYETCGLLYMAGLKGCSGLSLTGR